MGWEPLRPFQRLLAIPSHPYLGWMLTSKLSRSSLRRGPTGQSPVWPVPGNPRQLRCLTQDQLCLMPVLAQWRPHQGWGWGGKQEQEPSWGARSKASLADPNFCSVPSSLQKMEHLIKNQGFSRDPPSARAGWARLLARSFGQL